MQEEAVANSLLATKGTRIPSLASYWSEAALESRVLTYTQAKLVVSSEEEMLQSKDQNFFCSTQSSRTVST